MHVKGTEQAGSNAEEVLMMILSVYRRHGQVMQQYGSSTRACVGDCTYQTLGAYLINCTYLTDCIYLISGQHFRDHMYLPQGKDACLLAD